MPVGDQPNYGNGFVENLGFHAKPFNFLFFILFATLFFTAAIGNVIFFDLDIFYKTLSVASVCAAFFVIFYSVSRLLNNIVLGMVSLYGLILGVVYFNSFLINVFFYVFAGAACIYAFCFLRITRAEFLTGLGAGLVGAVTVLGIRGGYTSFNMSERLVAGAVHQDTLFHSSIAAMIKNYGIASTGLHGLVEIPYHVLSHWLVAGVSLLSNVSVLDVYGFAPYMFFIPMLFLAIVSFCILLNQDNKKINIAVLWILSCLLLTLIPYYFWKFGLSNSYFVSESYTVSLGLFLLGLSLLYKRELDLSDIILACLLAAMTTSAKASVGLIYMGLWWIRILFFRQKGEVKTLLAGLLISVIIFLTVFESAKSSAALNEFGPFSYIEYYSFWGRYIRKAREAYYETGAFNILYLAGSLASILIFTIMHFFMSWIAVGQSVYKKGWAFLWRSPVALYSLGATGAGMLIIGVLDLAGGSAYYFSNVAFFVSLPTVLLLCHTGIMKLGAERISWNKKNSAVMVFTFALVMAIGYSPMRHLFKEHVRIKEGRSSFVETLVDIRKNSPIDQCLILGETLMAQNPVSRVTARPFVYPAVSERPWINVVPKNESAEKYQFYGYAQYGITPLQQAITIDPVLIINKNRKLQPVEIVQ